MILIFSISLIAFIILMAIFIVSINKEKNLRGKGLITGYLISVIVILSILLISIIKFYEPTAIDVYKGKTSLEITFKNKIPVDSTVVYR